MQALDPEEAMKNGMVQQCSFKLFGCWSRSKRLRTLHKVNAVFYQQMGFAFMILPRLVSSQAARRKAEDEAKLAKEEARLAEEARRLEEVRLTQEAAKFVVKRLTEEARLAEEAKLIEEARLKLAEQAKLAEEARVASLSEEQRAAEAEAKRKEQERSLGFMIRTQSHIRYILCTHIYIYYISTCTHLYAHDDVYIHLGKL